MGPFLSLTFGVSDSFAALYFGCGVARTIRVQDTNLSPPRMTHPITVSWDSIDFIAPERQRSALWMAHSAVSNRAQQPEEDPGRSLA